MNIEDYCFCAVMDTYFTKEMEKCGCTVVQMYKSIPYFLKAVRKIHKKLNIPGFRIWLAKVPDDTWNKKIYIIYASEYSREFAKIVREKTDAPIFFWYNNIIETDGMFHKNLKITNFYPSSFDEDDCKKYGLFHNTQYYFSGIQLPDENIQYDVSCLCKDKGRADSLVRLEKYLKEMGLRTYFHICKDDTSSNKNGVQYKPQVSYSEVLRIIAQSKVIIDLTQDKQQGLTLRPLESIFFKKKLITNNKNIKNARFYNENNICIIDVKNPKIPKSFFELDYEELEKVQIQYYDFLMWLSRFDNVQGEE